MQKTNFRILDYGLLKGCQMIVAGGGMIGKLDGIVDKKERGLQY